jgi:hypothetical protein
VSDRENNSCPYCGKEIFLEKDYDEGSGKELEWQNNNEFSHLTFCPYCRARIEVYIERHCNYSILKIEKGW